jgi:hypothetical protein
VDSQLWDGNIKGKVPYAGKVTDVGSSVGMTNVGTWAMTNVGTWAIPSVGMTNVGTWAISSVGMTNVGTWAMCKERKVEVGAPMSEKESEMRQVWEAKIEWGLSCVPSI